MQPLLGAHRRRRTSRFPSGVAPGPRRGGRAAGLAALALALAALGCGAPATNEAQLPGDDTRDVWVLVVHGAGDGPERWAAPFAAALEPKLLEPRRVAVVAYDWREAARDRLAAAGAGQAEGAAIAKALQGRALTHLHLVVHSAGAHVAFGLEQALADWPSRPTLHLTLLDPFQGLGLDFEWGRARFGRTADFTESWLNRGDGVPGTEAPVDAAHTFDVTSAASRPAGLSGSQPHWWPIDAYQALPPSLSTALEVSGAFEPQRLRERFPPGAVTQVP
ncbi:MAG: alpha/beta fold hydrolase [Myxococcaceae bacterium]|jgi:hypothetical protein|nr:alpha/beta fold hydrolase [Myxococcaceae bacterium]MCA3016876.1 alpha/beta fold hydrolase [Myxococcaceae bacterium]